MHDLILANQAEIFFGSIVVGFVVVALLEEWRPRRRPSTSLRIRWPNNLLVWLLDIVLVRAALPAVGIGFAILAEQRGWGLFHHVDAPTWLVIVVSLVLLDLSQWFQHFLLHRIPLLWRFHAMHHTDVDYDVTTGVRFHPIESFATTIASMATIGALGVPPIVALAYLAVYGFMTMFVHGNVALSERLDRTLRVVLVTPDVHRTHHSNDPREQQTNFGGVTPIWDRLFGCYQGAPRLGHEGMRIGLRGFEERRHQTLPWMLACPLLGLNAEADAPATGQAPSANPRPPGT